jgi:hypothetical protein
MQPRDAGGIDLLERRFEPIARSPRRDLSFVRVADNPFSQSVTNSGGRQPIEFRTLTGGLLS